MDDTTGASGSMGGADATFPEPQTPDAKTWAAIAHLGALILGFLAPLIVYIMKKDEDPFVREHAREALNFQIVVLIAVVISLFLALILIGFLLLFLIAIVNFVLVIIAGIKAANGEPYRYPFNIQFVK